jgi:hypothetical protein
MDLGPGNVMPAIDDPASCHDGSVTVMYVVLKALGYVVFFPFYSKKPQRGINSPVGRRRLQRIRLPLIRELVE